MFPVISAPPPAPEPPALIRLADSAEPAATEQVCNALVSETWLGLAHGRLQLRVGLFLAEGLPLELVAPLNGDTPHVLLSLVDLVQADCWEQVAGRHLRVKRQGERIVALADLLADSWWPVPATMLTEPGRV